MSRTMENKADVDSILLQSAFLCVDCESVSNTHKNECPICGSHSLLSLAGMMGGTLLEYKASRLEKEILLLFDLDIRIEVKDIEGRDLSAVIEGVTSLIRPKLGRNRASFHINVEPVGSGTMYEEKAA